MANSFDVVLFSDRKNEFVSNKVRQADFREISLPFTPSDINIVNSSKPSYAHFADLFRYKLLSQEDGWWFDTDTLVLADCEQFSELLPPNGLSLAYEDESVVGNSVIGSSSNSSMENIYRAALEYFPRISRWGVSGPQLITKLCRDGTLDSVRLLSSSAFFPVHYEDADHFFRESEFESVSMSCKVSLCVSLWNKVLHQKGLLDFHPSEKTYIGRYLANNFKSDFHFGNNDRVVDAVCESAQDGVKVASGTEATRLAFNKLLDKTNKLRKRVIHREF